jgi:hypothetical protein
MSVWINNTLISIALCASAVFVMFSFNGAFDAVQSVGRAAMILAWPRREQDQPTMPPANFVFGPNGNIMGATQGYAHSGSWKVFRSNPNIHSYPLGSCADTILIRAMSALGH